MICINRIYKENQKLLNFDSSKSFWVYTIQNTLGINLMLLYSTSFPRLWYIVSLKTSDTYTRYKSIVRKHKNRKTFVKDLADQVQLDLVDMGKYGSKNKGYRWILTAVEILSRYAFAIPVRRKDGENMTKAVRLLLESFKKKFGKYPNFVQFDEGKEFYNVGVRNLLKSNDVSYFSTMSDKKAAVVERFNRTLKAMMWKYFYSKGTYAWIDVLDELVENYNGTRHGSTLMKPADVNSSNKDAVWVTLYGSALGELPLPKFRVGDTVRVSRYKSVYEANFTEEIFKVTRVLRGDPNVYELEDHEGEPIVGKFYEEELSVVEKKDDNYRVEKILRKKNGMALVKWLGYDSRSWVPLKDIKDVISS